MQKGTKTVNPARAGMIPVEIDVPVIAGGKPRASGDDPWVSRVWTGFNL